MLFPVGYDAKQVWSDGMLRESSVEHLDKEASVGINRWSGGREQRKIRETDTKAGDQVPEGKKGDPSSRLEGSEDPTEDEEKREVVEKLKKREQGS